MAKVPENLSLDQLVELQQSVAVSSRVLLPTNYKRRRL